MPVDPLHAVTPVIEIADRIFNFIKGKTNAQRLKLIAALVGEAFTQKMEESDVLAEWRDKERWARIVNQIGLLRAQNAELQYRYDCMKLGAQLFRAFAIRAESVDLYEKACEVDRDIKYSIHSSQSTKTLELGAKLDVEVLEARARGEMLPAERRMLETKTDVEKADRLRALQKVKKCDEEIELICEELRRGTQSGSINLDVRDPKALGGFARRLKEKSQEGYDIFVAEMGLDSNNLEKALDAPSSASGSVLTHSDVSSVMSLD